MEAWSRGAFTAPNADEAALLNANALGQVEVLTTLLETISQPLESHDN